MIDRYSTPQMNSIWSEQAKMDAWLEVEKCVCEVMFERGQIPHDAMEKIRAVTSVDAERVVEIERDIRHDVLSFLTALEEIVGTESRYIHQGMTSSDLLDTALALQIKRAGEVILPVLGKLRESLITLGRRYESLPAIGRTHGIHGQPISFGLRFMGFAAEMERGIERFRSALDGALTGTISGAVGSYVELAPDYEESILERLGLHGEAVPTQVVARDRHAALLFAMASIGAGIERLATEIRHLQRTEVREVSEGFGKKQKGSSAMPHKKNPILSENLCGLARLLRSYVIPALENITLWHERDISHSSVERVVVPDAFQLLHFMLARATTLVEELAVDTEVVKSNLQATGGLHFSGALLVRLCEEGLSRDKAYALVQGIALRCWEERSSFVDAVRASEEVAQLLSKDSLDEVLSIERHLKHTDAIMSRVDGGRGKQ